MYNLLKGAINIHFPYLPDEDNVEYHVIGADHDTKLIKTVCMRRGSTKLPDYYARLSDRSLWHKYENLSGKLLDCSVCRHMSNALYDHTYSHLRMYSCQDCIDALNGEVIFTKNDGVFYYPQNLLRGNENYVHHRIASFNETKIIAYDITEYYLIENNHSNRICHETLFLSTFVSEIDDFDELKIAYLGRRLMNTLILLREIIIKDIGNIIANMLINSALLNAKMT